MTTSRASGVRTAKQVAGSAGEEMALRHLLGRGLILVERNYRCRGGEIDLIMREGQTLVFIEVRTRSAASHGGAASSVTTRKQARLVIAAHTFLARYRAPPACRFDVVAIEGEQLNWITNAFDA